MGPKQTLQMFQMKTTYHGRRPQMEDYLKWKSTLNIKSEISQKLLIRSSPNLKLRLMNVSNEDDLQWKTTSNR